MGCLKKMCLALACYCVSYAATVNNPIIWADVPDVSVMRVDDTYYMVSTTMHFAPGVPIMASKNLAEWRTIGYAYQTLTNNNKQNLEAGENAYGKGSWASSIRYNKGYFYVLTPSYTTGKTHLYKTKDIENGSWSEITLPFYHDPSLFFDDDGSVFVIYGSGDISYVELNSDVSGVKIGGKSGKLSGVNIDAVTGASGYIVKQEGAQIVKVNGKYYLFTISWPNGKCRTEIVYRSKTLLGNYTGRIFLQNNGVAQGGIFLDAFGMNDGDIAGLVALQDSMGYVGIKKSDNNYSAVMYHGAREVATKNFRKISKKYVFNKIKRSAV